MSHVCHEALDGFDERQILYDGCPECEARGDDLQLALAHMDTFTFERAWKRAFDLHVRDDTRVVGPVSYAESDLLAVLYALQVEFARRGIELGTLPEPVYG